jgi:hypothetical protein
MHDVLLGRDRERAAIDRLLAGAANGESGSLVIRRSRRPDQHERIVKPVG